MQAIEHLTANAADNLVDHPAVSQLAVTLITGAFVVFAVPAWTRLVSSDRGLRMILRLGGRGLGLCLVLTAMVYDSIVRGLGVAITSQPMISVYDPASIMLSCAAIVFAGFQVSCALFVRSVPLLQAAVPALLGPWLFALAVPVHQFTVLLGLGR